MTNLLDRLASLHGRADGALAALPAAIPLLALRIALAIPFWRSGLTKWDGFLNLSAGARFLFAEEFRLHIFGEAYPFPAPLTMAYLSSLGEVVLPVLLVVGLFTRFAALGILLMTIVIQLTVPDGLINFHLPWAAMALALVAYGGGWFSADRLVFAGGARVHA